VLAGPALEPDRGLLPGDLLADLLVYSCPTGDPEANALRRRLAPGTLARADDAGLGCNNFHGGTTRQSRGPINGIYSLVKCHAIEA
jgi:hypothetical protein